MATKSESSSKAKASVKNIIKIAIGELKRKRKKKGKKRVRKPTAQQEVREVPQFQTMGNFRNLASPAPATLSGLLNIGREFRDVQLSQQQLTQRVDTRIRSSERAIRDEVEREYRRMARSLGATQSLTQAQERDIERLTREVRTALGLAGRTAEGLERFTTSGVFQQAVRTALNTLLPDRLRSFIQGKEGGELVGFKGGEFLLEAQQILTKPQKGGAKRGASPARSEATTVVPAFGAGGAGQPQRGGAMGGGMSAEAIVEKGAGVGKGAKKGRKGALTYAEKLEYAQALYNIGVTSVFYLPEREGAKTKGRQVSLIDKEGNFNQTNLQSLSGSALVKALDRAQEQSNLLMASPQGRRLVERELDDSESINDPFPEFEEEEEGGMG